MPKQNQNVLPKPSGFRESFQDYASRCAIFCTCTTGTINYTDHSDDCLVSDVYAAWKKGNKERWEGVLALEAKLGRRLGQDGYESTYEEGDV